MQSISDPLNRLQEDGSWFARAHEIKIFVVRTSGDIRKTVLRLLPMFEFHADNFSPWVLLEDARTSDNDGWQIRANRLIQDWERRRETFAKEDINLPEVKVINISNSSSKHKTWFFKYFSSSKQSQDLQIFHETIVSVLRALRNPLRGLVLILAPTIVDNMAALEKEIEALIFSPDLQLCRFILVLDADLPLPHSILNQLGKHGLVCECVVDAKQFEKDLDAMLVSSNGAENKNITGACPRGVVPPRRIDDPPEIPKEERDALLREAGINPVYLVEAPRLRNLVLGASLAMKKGRGEEAILKQREACTLSEGLEMHELKVICQIALGNYFSGMNQPELAIKELKDAVQYAANHNLPRVQCQAHLALGLLFALAKKFTEASFEYVQSAKTAETAKVELIAIEGWRLAGQIALQAGNDKEAALYFQEAIRIATKSEPNLVKTSSAPEIARRLATIYKDWDMHSQAKSLFNQADQMERGEFVMNQSSSKKQEPSGTTYGD